MEQSKIFAVSDPPVQRRSTAKVWLWALMAVATLSLIPFTELPILRDKTGINVAYRAQLWHDRFLLAPHAICGILALLIGPAQFSTRLRQRYLKLHRVLGRVYVFAVLIAAVIAMILTQGSGLEIATYVQGGAWIVCTVVAFLTARNRHILAHKQWMVRSYAVTFTFISTRVLNFWPAYAQISVATNLLVIILVTFLSVFLPDIAFNWRELTTRRA
jgi:uncharacterized membrane protein